MAWRQKDFLWLEGGEGGTVHISREMQLNRKQWPRRGERKNKISLHDSKWLDLETSEKFRPDLIGAKTLNSREGQYTKEVVRLFCPLLQLAWIPWANHFLRTSELPAVCHPYSIFNMCGPSSSQINCLPYHLTREPLSSPFDKASIDKRRTALSSSYMDKCVFIFLSLVWQDH